MFSIQNQTLQAKIESKGAELQSIYHLSNELEYLWSRDPAFWSKSSPVLFPVVGTLKDNTYFYEGKPYHLPRHGFAREKEFAITAQTNDSITFTLESSDETLVVYPFAFRFSIVYSLQEDKLIVRYRIENTDDKNIYFSVGGHPAFAIPLVTNTSYNDYYLQFEKEETASRWPINKEGLIATEPQPLLHHTNRLPLTKELFSKDALVLKNLQSNSVTLQSDKTKHGLRFSFAGFPYLGLWAAKDANFICIEPWQGIADGADTDQQLVHKEGIVQLPPEETFAVQWEVQCF